MTITRVHGSSLATQWLRILSDYAYLSDDSNFSRRISQIAPEEIPISSEERKNSSEESNDTSEESYDKSEEICHSFGRKSRISPDIFENSSGEIEMSLLSLYYNASALGGSPLDSCKDKSFLYLCTHEGVDRVICATEGAVTRVAKWG